ncbi:S-layer homology domain-containing protein [Paenibacillus sp. 1_12]|uniref:S-layer homology domain-containing protein n=1 Tax=Paenibacillus sp. 1_12 TaxID=1566278 RepID=UPI0008DFC534|nr:S-layer homology domain-containing protein [Paenibacillus sp. 1_12]SFM39199.1 S-layer homology domain-containing protein [Paenibacillus sp. 1_12]
MKTKILLGILYLLFAFGAGFHLPAASAANGGPAFSLSSGASFVNAGNTYTVTLRGQGIKDLYAFQALFEYDTNYFEFIEVKKSLTSTGTTVYKDRGTEVLFGFTKIGNASAESGDMDLCAITFKAKLSGATAIKLKSVDILDNGNSGQTYAGNSELPVQIVTANQPGDGNGTENGTENGTGNRPGSGTGNTGTAAPRPTTPQTEEPNQAIAKTSVTAENLNAAFKQAKQDSDGVKRVVIELLGTETAKEYAFELPAQALIASGMEHEIVLLTPFCSVQLPGDMLNNTGLEGNQNIIFSIGLADTSGMDAHAREIIGYRPVIELKITADDKTIHWNNPDSPVKVSINYKPTADELNQTEHIVIVYINETGKVEAVPTGNYDAFSGKVTFKTTHFSKYAVAVVYKTFDDISEYAWAKNAIDVLASKGVISGMTDEAFAPSKKISRADFIVLLVRGLGLSAKIDSNFDDIAETDYFYHSVGIAKKLGITGGVGANKFNPQAEITRQDMFVLTARAFEFTKKVFAAGNTSEIKRFNDASDVAEYARESIATLIKEGIIEGSGSLIAPKNHATRAETAVIVYRLYQH